MTLIMEDIDTPVLLTPIRFHYLIDRLVRVGLAGIGSIPSSSTGVLTLMKNGSMSVRILKSSKLVQEPFCSGPRRCTVLSLSLTIGNACGERLLTTIMVIVLMFFTGCAAIRNLGWQGDDLHRWLTVARLTALSLGEETVTESHWSHVKDLEAQVAQRADGCRIRAGKGDASAPPSAPANGDQGLNETRDLQ